MLWKFDRSSDMSLCRTKAREFTSKPLTNLTDIVLPAKKKFPKTRPVQFQLATDARGEEKAGRMKEKACIL